MLKAMTLMALMTLMVPEVLAKQEATCDGVLHHVFLDGALSEADRATLVKRSGDYGAVHTRSGDCLRVGSGAVQPLSEPSSLSTALGGESAGVPRDSLGVCGAAHRWWKGAVPSEVSAPHMVVILGGEPEEGEAGTCQGLAGFIEGELAESPLLSVVWVQASGQPPSALRNLKRDYPYRAHVMADLDYDKKEGSQGWRLDRFDWEVSKDDAPLTLGTRISRRLKSEVSRLGWRPLKLSVRSAADVPGLTLSASVEDGPLSSSAKGVWWLPTVKGGCKMGIGASQDCPIQAEIELSLSEKALKTPRPPQFDLEARLLVSGPERVGKVELGWRDKGKGSALNPRPIKTAALKLSKRQSKLPRGPLEFGALRGGKAPKKAPKVKAAKRGKKPPLRKAAGGNSWLTSQRVCAFSLSDADSKGADRILEDLEWATSIVVKPKLSSVKKRLRLKTSVEGGEGVTHTLQVTKSKEPPEFGDVDGLVAVELSVRAKSKWVSNGRCKAKFRIKPPPKDEPPWALFIIIAFVVIGGLGVWQMGRRKESS